MRRPAVRIVVCLAWLASSVVGPLTTLVVLVHLAGEHHLDAFEAQELALEATHGHHHELGVVAHWHPAERATGSVEPVTTIIASLVHSVATYELASSDGPTRDAPAATESPPISPPLFCKHCALLL